MKLDSLHVNNYRALRDVEIPFSSFVCLTVENNAGKSSFLQALSLFLRGTVLAETNFFDPNESIVIAVGFDEVGEDDIRIDSQNLWGLLFQSDRWLTARCS